MNRVPFRINSCVWKNVTFSTCSTVCKQANVSRQGKIFSKLFGKRMPGSKKLWVENPTPSAQFQHTSPFQFTSKKSDQNSKRRTTVLNKLFMGHITDLLATGEASLKVLGKGLQITRVKITPNFQFCNVYWMAQGGPIDDELEQELQKCGGLLRHELSQLRLMGEVPRIHFVKDKASTNIALVETILNECDFGEPDDLNQQSLAEEEEEEEPIPPMRHDVFGLDHREIMLKILAKMKKSEKALQNGESSPQTAEDDEEDDGEATSRVVVNPPEPEDDEEFRRFLLKMEQNEKYRNRRFRRTDDGFYRKIGDDEDDPLEDGDFIDDEFDEKK